MKPERGGVSLLRPCVTPGGEPFELKIGFRHDRRDTAEVRQAIEALALTSLWLACAYGGLGARVRRGFGGMRIVAVAGNLPRPWTPRGILTPGLELYRSARWLWPWSAATSGIFEQYLRVLAEAPDYPVLSKRCAPENNSRDSRRECSHHVSLPWRSPRSRTGSRSRNRGR